ncbi:hypothetical protein [Hymenobacter koreensis]|uniref:Uncharacterized protein n=1 Tax=Hymenobacter koreensis TaxID=1084523 RepID=A0ABP8JJK7_9BACT
MPSYCNWHRGPVRLDSVEYTCHSDKTDFILVAKYVENCEVRIPSADAVALRDNLNDYLAMSQGNQARRVLDMEAETARLRIQIGDLKHKLQTMRGVLDKAIKGLD